ncbi:MAG: hypothetical protein ANABAC_1925 [Anaerolineae bacterium]|jgi:hypothetical protein|nr:MAG: hypothetical protein ANABAC_1925 [Anaerolineae bacterium]
MKRVVLLDIDGVLVRPLGYRAALRASLATFAAWMGFDAFQVEEEVISQLEARGISSEFDMLPLLVGALFDAVLSRTAPMELAADLEEAARQVAELHPQPVRHLQVPAFPLQESCFPAEAAYRSGIYPALPDDLRRSLLLNTRNVYQSATTRLFQQYVLGSQRFGEVYGLTAQVHVPAYLQAYDQPLLDSSCRARFEKAWRGGEFQAAAMTARPSSPPRGVTSPPEPYPPEAEAALELIGLPDLPLVALGKLDYVARQAKLPVESLLKPAPAQALAATLVACGADERTAIEGVVAWLSQPSPALPFDNLPPQLELHVVEDTLAGIHSVRAAAELLKQNGYNVHVVAWGLTDGNPLKRKTLTSQGVQCWDTWEQLLEQMGI